MSVRARGLTVTRGERTLLRDVTCTVHEGERVHVAGASGAGKTTLLKALGGLLALAPDARVTGTLEVAGVDPRDAPAPELAARVGQVPQVAEDALLALDARGEIALRLENQGVPEDEGVPCVDAALATWGLTALADRRTVTFSTGEAKRVALAAALATDPRVLLLDEPFTGLDPRARRDVAALLRAGARERTLLVAEHERARVAPFVTRTLDLPSPARDPPARAVPRPPPGAPVLTTRGLACARRGGPVAVAGVDLALAPGFVAVAGWNGAGKSTLLRALLGLDAPHAGRVTLAGLDAPHRAPPRELARRVGYAGPLSGDFFTTTRVRDELALTARAPPSADLVRAFRLDGLLDRHPLALSGGERQRLALAAAVAHAPRVLVLDEPTVGLDAAARAALMDAVARVVADGGLVLAATHDEALLARAHRVLVVDAGRVEEAPSADAFFEGAGRRLGYARLEEVHAA